MAFRRQRKNGTRIWAIAIACSLGMLALGPVAAASNYEDYQEPRRLFWKPTYGWMTTKQNPSGSQHPHHVDEFFSWDNSIAYSRLDHPRTPYQWGAYEHVMFFQPHSSSGRIWCEGTAYNYSSNLPADSYRDSFGSNAGEFTWGMQGWRLAYGYLYEIHYDCDPTSGSGDLGNRYYSQAQIGHCDSPPCDTYDTFGDDTTFLILEDNGVTPDPEQYFTGSIQADPDWGGDSFESDLYPWDTVHGSASRQCNVTSVVTGSCRVKLVDGTSSGNVSFSFVYQPTPSSAATKFPYNEVWFRCTASCSPTLAVRALDSSGNVLQSYSKAVSVPADGYWYPRHFDPGQGLPSGTTQWKFVIQGGAGDTIFIDYAQQAPATWG